MEDIEEEEEIEVPKRFSDGDTVQEVVQELLNELDPFDPVSLNNDVMSRRIHELVERTAALSHSQVVNGRTAIAREDPEDHHPRVPTTSKSILGSPLAKGTPAVESGRKRSVRFYNLDRVQEEPDEENRSVEINYDHHPLDTLALFMSAMNQQRSLNQ